MKRILLTLALGGATAALPATAHAGKTNIALDADIGGNIENGDIAAGMAIRVGYKLQAVIVQFTPEIGARYLMNEDADLITGFAGARLSVGKIINPGVFGHVGLAKAGGYVDAGGFLDFTPVPVFKFGVHGGYAAYGPNPWGFGGVHAYVQF